MSATDGIINGIGPDEFTRRMMDYDIELGADGKVVDCEYSYNPLEEAFYKGSDGGLEPYKFHEALDFFKGFGFRIVKLDDTGVDIGPSYLYADDFVKEEL